MTISYEWLYAFKNRIALKTEKSDCTNKFRILFIIAQMSGELKLPMSFGKNSS